MTRPALGLAGDIFGAREVIVDPAYKAFSLGRAFWVALVRGQLAVG
jgi:hypothetical protein